MKSDQLAGAILMAVGLCCMGWGIYHYRDPLVPSTFHTYGDGRSYYGQSRALTAVTCGLAVIWLGWCVSRESKRH
jgi:hypothetical protein